MSDADDRAYGMLGNAVRTMLATESRPTPGRVREVIAEYCQIPNFAVSSDKAEALAKEIEERLDISMSVGSVVKCEFAEWLNAVKKDIDPYYWDRYRRLLEQKKFPPQVIAKTDYVTDRIVGLLENPQKRGPWDRRGMVVGNVQSGKTANYTGVICKAADAGYRLIIVIAGVHNNLRNQTQGRIDEGFIGRDSDAAATGNISNAIGVGKFDNVRRPVSLTNAMRDFNKHEAESNAFRLKDLKEPIVLVIKKHPGTLSNVINWLKEHNASGHSEIIDAPMLLIDDEADNASIDVAKSLEEASRINSLIRKVLNLFNRSCYVGYTATPFANIFIDPETETAMLGGDLFPRDFIVGLDSPSNYLGAYRIFGENADVNCVRQLTDNEDLLPLKHKNHHPVSDLPPSLKAAIRTWIIASAIRILRGQNTAHNSMLVNASRFTSVQTQLRNVIHGFVDRIKRRVRLEGMKPAEDALRDDEMRALRDVWSAEYGTLEFSWGQVQGKLHEAAAPIEVVEINSRSTGALNYRGYEDSGRNVVAVGGFSLSRGLTLEGLTVSYILRNSMMYDTLLQMGRWFGFRPGFEDLCRVWMTPEAEGWYQHITESIEELRGELRDMEQANKTPREFGLKVRSHPSTLIVTARNKMGTGKKVPVQIGLSNNFVETAVLWKRKIERDTNRAVAKHLLEHLEKHCQREGTDKAGNYLWTNVGVEPVLDFVGAFKNHPLSVRTDPRPVQSFIRRRGSDELVSWDVALLSKTTGKDISKEQWLGLEVGCQDRSEGRESYQKDDYIRVGEKQRVADSSMEKLGMGDDLCLEAEEDYKEDQRREHGPDWPDSSTVNYPGRAYRKKRTRPLLMIHLLRMLSPKRSKEDADQAPLFEEGVIAWSISFPQSKYPDDTVEYVVNTTWWQENYGQDVDEELGELD